MCTFAIVSEKKIPIKKNMIREASQNDLPQLIEIESRSFGEDKFSRRSLKYLLSRANATTLVETEKGNIRGYALILYNRSTSLSRLYSLVVDMQFRGLGLARKLLKAAEKDAINNDCVIMRLEVRMDNIPAITLYTSAGYKKFDVFDDYYHDHSDALRMEKSLVPHPRSGIAKVPYYQQTLDFTCGPAALMMGMSALSEEISFNRKLELRLWRESTTIFMTSGLGGCSPFGLALSAFQRGFNVELYVNETENFFINSVRDPQKKEVIRLVQEDQLQQLSEMPVKINHGILSTSTLQEKFTEGRIPIVLISSYRIYREKNPHWVVLTGFNDRYFFVHDSFVDHQEGKNKADSINMPILKKDFERMSRYGKAGQKAVIILSKRDENESNNNKILE